MKVVTTIDNRLEITSTYENNTRNVQLKDLLLGHKYEVTSDGSVLKEGKAAEQPVTCAAFEVLVSHGEVHLIHLVGNRETIIIQKDGQVQSLSPSRSISSKMTDTGSVGKGQNITGFTLE
jgi:hypothetical protein